VIAYSQLSNLVVYRLLLRDLFQTCSVHPISTGVDTHLVDENRLPQLIDEPSDLLSILCLVEEPSALPLRQ